VVECRQDRPGAGIVRPRARVGTLRRRLDGAGGFVDLKLGHYNKDGIEVVDVEGEIDVYTAPRLRELLIDLVNKNNYQLVVNMEKVEFLDSTGLGVLVGGLKRVRAHDGSLDLVCTQERILKIFRITGLTKVFGIHETVDLAIAAKKSEK
jgi:anti-sigma B factor antagonist